jgi:hypothetical protein
LKLKGIKKNLSAVERGLKPGHINRPGGFLLPLDLNLSAFFR